ncbi:MAG: histidinol-phosphatase [Bacilli bacterium]
MSKFKCIYNYHTHTSRCGHAHGTDEEYVVAALEAGIKRLGFSDHVILPLIHEPWIRGEYEKLDDYLASCAALKKKYAGKIEILTGFEAEYSKTYKDYYTELLRSKKVDYLILGQHCYFEDDKGIFYFREIDNKEKVQRYADDLCAGMESKLFKYVAHPDLFVTSLSKFDEFAKKISLQIIKCAKKCSMPLEINLGGVRYPRGVKGGWLSDICSYPYAPFWKLVKDFQVEIVIGVDAHWPTDFTDPKNDKITEFISENKLKINEDYNILN